MKLTSGALLGFVLALSASAQEWQPLFDGRTLRGWRAAQSPASFQAVDGRIVCSGAPGTLFFAGRGGEADFTNFEFSAEVLTHEGGDSGVYFHAPFQEGVFPARGLEAQVLNVARTRGGYRESELTGSLYGLRGVYKPLVPEDEWFTNRISVRGKRVQIRINDVLVVDYLEPTPAPEIAGHPERKLGHGSFALQCSGSTGKVAFRNLKVRRLPATPAEELGTGPCTPFEQECFGLISRNVPLVNYHVHLKGGLTLQEALALSRQTGIFYGLAVNCGLNFSVTNDAGIEAYLQSIKGQPAFVAMQAEGREWVKLFSREAISRFDYVFTDSMTIFDEQGRRMRLWIPEEVPAITDAEAFMDMLVERTVTILSTEPIDVYVNPTFLPAQIAAKYDRLWTGPRMKKVIDAAVTHHVAIEINSRYRLPSPAFLKMAKAAGARFTFGTNNGDRDVGRLDYSFEMVRELKLGAQDIWLPVPKGGK